MTDEPMRLNGFYSRVKALTQFSFISGRNTTQLLTEKKRQSKKHQQIINELQNGYRTNRLYKKYQEIDHLLLILLLMSIFLLISYFQHQIKQINPPKINSNRDFSKNLSFFSYFFQGLTKSNVLLLCNSIIIVLSLFLSIFKFSLQNAFLQNQKCDKISWINQLFDLLIVLVNPLPFKLNDPLSTIQMNVPYNDNFPNSSLSYEMKINHLILVLCGLKMVLFVRGSLEQLNISINCLDLDLNLNKYSSAASNRLNKMYSGSGNPSLAFTLRCLFKDYPFFIMIYLLLTMLLTLAYLIRITQSYYHQPTFSLTSFQNCFWLIFITMTSVGFGDLYPRTLCGMIISWFSIVIGVVILALILVFTHQIWSFSDPQRNTVKILKKLEINKNRKEIAGKYLALALIRSYRAYKIYKKAKEYLLRKEIAFNLSDLQRYKELMESSLQEKKYLRHFKQLTKEYKYNICDKSDEYFMMYNNFSVCSLMLDEIQEHSDTLSRFVSAVYFKNSYEGYMENKDKKRRNAKTLSPVNLIQFNSKLLQNTIN